MSQSQQGTRNVEVGQQHDSVLFKAMAEFIRASSDLTAQLHADDICNSLPTTTN